MRTQSQIQQQLKQVVYRHLQKKLRMLFKKKPTTCRHNREFRFEDGSYVRLCGVRNPMIPCDDRIPGCSELARECPLWKEMRDKQDVKAEYHDLIQSSDRGRIAARYPDIAALMWVLDDTADVPSESDIDEMGGESEDEEEDPGSLWGWFKRLGKTK